MAELSRIKSTIEPDETLLVVDAMTGQEAANLTRTFHEQIGITGCYFDQMDGDSRGGAAFVGGIQRVGVPNFGVKLPSVNSDPHGSHL